MALRTTQGLEGTMKRLTFALPVLALLTVSGCSTPARAGWPDSWADHHPSLTFGYANADRDVHARGEV